MAVKHKSTNLYNLAKQQLSQIKFPDKNSFVKFLMIQSLFFWRGNRVSPDPFFANESICWSFGIERTHTHTIETVPRIYPWSLFPVCPPFGPFNPLWRHTHWNRKFRSRGICMQSSAFPLIAEPCPSLMFVFFLFLLSFLRMALEYDVAGFLLTQ